MVSASLMKMLHTTRQPERATSLKSSRMDCHGVPVSYSACAEYHRRPKRCFGLDRWTDNATIVGQLFSSCSKLAASADFVPRMIYSIVSTPTLAMSSIVGGHAVAAQPASAFCLQLCRVTFSSFFFNATSRLSAPIFPCQKRNSTSFASPGLQ